MALDRSLALIRGLPGVTPERLVRQVAHGLAGLSVAPPTPGHRPGVLLPKIRSRHETNLRLYVPGLPAASLRAAVEELRAGRRNPYEILGDRGILVINSIQERKDGVILAGGSCSDVVLSIQGDHAVVVKSVAGCGGVGNADGLRRHRNEAEWLASVHDPSGLFLQTRQAVDRSDLCTFETDFFPAYSLAELVFQLRMTGHPLAEVLISIYEQLRSAFYSRDPIRTSWIDPDQNYVQKIRRRSRLLLDATHGVPDSITALIRAPKVRVNGRPCTPLAELLHTVDSHPIWRPIAWPTGKHACHGDLILEDILVKPHPAPDVRLVDPNPYNQHGLIDVAKTMLSLWIGYEFIYFDFFRVELEEVGQQGQVAVEVSLDLNGRGEQYTAAASQFIEYARTEIADVLGLPRHSFQRLIRMASALTALAIPSFHAIRHGRPDRALAFLALGMLHASYALADETPPPFCM